MFPSQEARRGTHEAIRSAQDSAGASRCRREAKQQQLGQRGCVLWFTGLSGSGKSTVAATVEHALADAGHATALLDGDNIRHGLNSNLGFSAVDRTENIRRIGEVSRLFVQTGLITLVAFISPYRADRLRVRDRVLPGDFIEVSKWQQVCKATSNISKQGSFVLLSLSMMTVARLSAAASPMYQLGLKR